MSDENITLGLAFLLKQQQPDGSFKSLSSAYPDDFTDARVLHSPFPTVLILSLFQGIGELQEIEQLKDKAASFLLSQKSEDWTFNYWVRGSIEGREMPYPDDLDVTFCVLSSLYLYKPEILNGVALAKSVQVLTSCEVKVGGPYRTWLVPESAPEVWKDVDVAVNSNVAYFLSLQGITLPKLSSYLSAQIASGTLASPYYPSAYPIIYFLSRVSHGKQAKALIDMLLSTRKGKAGWGNPLNSALAILSLLNLKVTPLEVADGISELVKQQQPDGSWKPSAFCIDPVIEGKRHFAGSEALTTAFCLSAILKYQKVIEQVTHKRRTEKLPTLHRTIVKNVRQRFEEFDESVTTPAHELIRKVVSGLKGKQITLVPYFVKESLGERGLDIPDARLIQLGMASLYGWTAYTIYDGFLDEEGDPKLLPVANIAHREVTRLFLSRLEITSEYGPFFGSIMDAMDQANAWEVTHCRVSVAGGNLSLDTLAIPDYGTYEWLAKRSLGHALAPCALLFSLGYGEYSPEVQNLLGFFRHYLIARQLNDDAHDFERDLRKGHINAVGAALLTRVKSRFKKQDVSLSALLPVLNELFWKEVVAIVCNEIFTHNRLARQALLQTPIISDIEIFERMLLSTELPAKKALNDHKNAMQFLKEYQAI